MLKLLITWVSFMIMPISVWAAEGGDGKITFYSYYLKERREVRYQENEKTLPEGVREIEKMFRSRDSESVHPIDIKLLRLIDRIEDHFGVRQVEIISGYRSQEFNKQLKDTGHRVANESYHIKGMAADIHLDEITEEAIRDYALSLHAGGVGYYAPLDMVHVDVGPVRTWGDPGARKPWVGEKNADFPLTATVQLTRSLSRSLDSLTLEPGPGASVFIKPALAIEFFDGGEWKNMGVLTNDQWDCARPVKEPRKVPLKELADFEKLPYGKFRFRMETCDGKSSQYSNEFYFKKI